MKTTPRLVARLLATLLLAAGLGGCIEDAEPAPDGAEGDGAADMAPDMAPTGPDPDYRRMCQPGDYDCNLDGCNGAGTDGPLGCFKPCAPASLEAAGERHPDCDEPARPFCSEVGLWEGGDYACNRCVYLCTAEPQGTRCNGRPSTCQ